MPAKDASSSILNKMRVFVVPRALKGTIWVGLVCLLALCGCSAVRVRLGTRVSLVKIPVASISSMAVSLPQGSAVAPGEKSPLVVTLTGPNAAVWVTEGAGKGKILWKDLAVTASVVRVDKKGILSLPHDPRISEGKTGHVTITAPSHPGLRAELDIPLRYDYNFASSFSGSKGSDGFNGTDGVDGVSGSVGSVDATNPSAGGNGTDGSNGSDGDDGSSGGDGPTVQMRVTLRAGSHPLLQIGALATGYKERFYLVDPQGGSLMVTSAGGAGGSGGKGGRGGRGGSGGVGTPNGSDGRAGSDGRNGMDGSPGRAGSIHVVYDPQAKPFLTAIHLPNGGGPAPVFTEEPVAALW